MSESIRKGIAALLESINRADTEAAALQRTAQAVVKVAQTVRDDAASIRAVLNAAPDDRVFPADSLEVMHVAWLSLLDSTKYAQGRLEAAYTPYALSAQGVTSTTSATLSSVAYFEVPPSIGLALRSAKTNLRAQADIDTLVQEVSACLTRLQLTAGSSNTRSPIDLLSEAIAAFRGPATLETSPRAVLLPLRACIAAVLENIRRRCLAQEESSSRKAKIAFIGKQCGRLDLPANHFESLAGTDGQVNTLLSKAKDALLSREEIGDRVRTALLHLKALLNSIDATKLRTA